MDAAQAAALAHPAWVWFALAAALLAVEMATGSGYLLWASASAGVVAVAVLAGLRLGWAGEAVLFAVLAIASTVLARRFWPRRPVDSPDVNDPGARLLGRQGRVVDGFAGGGGRVFVDGKEWAAEADGASGLTPGAPVEVLAVIDGGRLKVRPV